MRTRDPIWISLRGAKPPSRRSVDEAIFLRAPAVFRALAWLTFKLPRALRLRQAVIRRSVLQSQGAWMRRDFEAGFIRFAPGYVLAVGESDRMRMDFEASYRGREGVRAFTQTYQDAFGDSAYEPQWIVDLGGDVFVLELRDGLVVREAVHSAPRQDWASLARAVGLDSAELARRQSARTEAGAVQQITTP